VGVGSSLSSEQEIVNAKASIMLAANVMNLNLLIFSSPWAIARFLHQH
jgi:hypothetical protein